jgi:hypothetical protein
MRFQISPRGPRHVMNVRRNVMKLGDLLTRYATGYPKAITGLILVSTVLLALLAALPSIWPAQFPFLHPVDVDTDPENMLSHDEAVRVFHDDMKKLLSLHDMVVLGVVNEKHPDGVFNPESLQAVYDLTQYAKTLHGDALGLKDPGAGVVEVDLIAPSTVDNIEQAGPGTVRFEWLMESPPKTPEEALAVRQKAERIPFLNGTMISEDGKAICLYLPLTSKDLSYRVYTRLRERIAQIEGDDQFFITGLPVAEDTFGVEMFIQMAISAPLAMLVIFLLMLYFFRKLVLVMAPMIIAMVTVICTMGLLIVTGNTIHIMSSMIPIFIMPIAVLDSIHILSEFFDRYQETRDRKKTIRAVMDTLQAPMLFTSLTSAAGFGSLALTPIPPVQVFGMFVAFGVLLAWLFTIMLIPAYVTFIPERYLKNFGLKQDARAESASSGTLMGRLLGWASALTYRRAKLIVALSLAAVIVAGYGISRIQINDNPTKWFRQSHPIRVADKVLNEHFGGTYMAYLTLYPEDLDPKSEVAAVPGGSTEVPVAGETASSADSAPGLPAGLGGDDEPGLPAGLGGIESEPSTVHMDEPGTQRPEVFKDPEVLRYMDGLQQHLLTTGVVGKSNSLADIVKTVHRELIDGSEAQFRVPDSPGAVAQCLMQYQSSHRPHDLWHFVTPDYQLTSIWVQLRSGDNKDMERVVESVETYVAQNPPPGNLKHQWFGLTYINVIWQDKMVSGMLQSFLGSFLVVLLMMIVLFRSALWGLISMIPLTITIGLIYGVIGLIGKDYDMPVAVLSSLTLGLAVDFAIHFLARARTMYEKYGSWQATHDHVFGEPGRAIARNVIVIAVGFLPLLAAPLVPYNTVGVFLAAILFVSGVATLLILPSLIKLLEPLLFARTAAIAFTCKCGTCVAASVAAVALVAVNVHQFLEVGYSAMTWTSVIAIVVLASVCAVMSRGQSCRKFLDNQQEPNA